MGKRNLEKLYDKMDDRRRTRVGRKLERIENGLDAVTLVIV